MRRTRRGWGSIGLVLLLSGCWPMVGQGPDRNAHNPMATAISPATAGSLHEAWRVDPGPGLLAPVGSSS